jgi:type I restriction enzyme S subunit
MSPTDTDDRVLLAEVCRIDAPIVDPRNPPYCDLPHVSGEDIESGTGKLLPLHTAAEDGMTSGKYVFDPGVVLYSKLRPYLRKVAVADFRGLCSADMYPLVFDRERVFLDYAKFCLLADDFTSYAVEASARARMPKLNREQLLAYEFPLPSLAEQERIAGELTAAMAAVDRARRAAAERLAAAEALPAAYLREVFEGPDADGWGTRPLGDVCELLPSKSIATDGDTEVTAVTTACLSESGFLTDGVKLARMWAADAAICQLRPGEVLIARSNTPELVGRVSMYSGDPPGVVASDLTIRLWVRPALSAQFLTAYLSYLYQTGYWQGRAGGASGSMKKITREQITAEPVPLPSLAEQQQIAADLSARLAAAESLIARCREEVAAVEALPAALLREAFGPTS